MILFVTIAVLTAGGVYLVQQRSMVQIVFGVSLMSHAANFVLLAAGVPAWRGEPIASATAAESAADPLPQAFVLTAIVITLAVTVFMLMLAVLGHNDDTRRMPATGETHDR
ncbi:sodium:proton antiporter [Janibacter sp. GXQ6167]|uniref:sodium:proton antiporter n=1 Tax=Janibacter sp. GXQ6167 TaxID=3240791 RepID=UPI0035244B84